MLFYAIGLKDEEVVVVQSEDNLSHGDVVLFNHWNDFQHGSVIEKVDKLLGITTYKNAPKVLKFIEIKEFNKTYELKTKQALLLSAMNDIEDEIKIKDQRNKLAGKDNRFKELLEEFSKLENPIDISNINDDEGAKGEGSAE